MFGSKTKTEEAPEVRFYYTGPRWEYKIVNVDVKGIFSSSVNDKRLAKELDILGLAGWELVSVAGIMSQSGAMSSVPTGGALVCTMKRQLGLMRAVTE
jgi:hypothetical protein